jgi:S-adenosylmethionine:tRNA ribosyltransferase-isomerase
LHLSDYRFDLPDELIAQYPAQSRTDSRLLHLDMFGAVSDEKFPDCLEHMSEGDVLVLNNTKVIPARMFGKKQTGGRIEVLLERVLGEDLLLAQMRASKSAKVGSHILIDGAKEGVSLEVIGRQDNFFELKVHGVDDIYEWFDLVGSLPLPPYIERSDEHADFERYQTVFAEEKGAVAAPTAGLHFDQKLLERIKEKGIKTCEVTLHVGAGTYQPVRVENILEHEMHRERLTVTQEVCDVINNAKKNNNKIIAVGTTVVRSLETAAKESSSTILEPYSGETDIFIYPGFEFKVIDKLITNFHLSESTLLMLVSAFSGRDSILKAYNHAIDKKYRFFSYGDAMILEKNNSI